jgi:hypothetical protein
MIKRYMYVVVKITFPGKKTIYKVVETTSEFVPENHLNNYNKDKKGFKNVTKCNVEVASNLREYCEWWIEMRNEGKF